ncbi:putative porin [Flavobacterium sedimenticola]|uniref:Porin n=1 Tax=Flavobacterium sedimenticola TaxID=3043286 RepID=A0ABT6XQY5_9FLAO|nr:putative porin [Flavobacterium sedimenticola]MDI9257498.1 putative porin [Flavobacterium sedimenticola]
MRNTIAVFFVLLFSVGFAQTQADRNSANKDQQKPTPKAAYDQYRIITLQKDTTYVDTSLTIQKEYAYNYLRKDSFGLLPFANEGQTYTVLDFGFKKFAPYPEIGYAGKHFNFMKANDIQYYSVATPVTELYFKTVMEQGQCLDALIAVNTSERFNMSVAFKGLRSLGKYVNQLSSTGNFRFTSSYNTLNKRYYLNFHFTGQDILNGENGGITTLEDFEGEDPAFQNRARLEVYLRDAKSFLKGKRFFIDHSFLINKKKGNNNLYINHQFNYETKFFEYNQATVASTVGNTQILRFGEANVSSNINDQNRYNRLYNKFGATYENSLLGTFRFFTEDFRYNYFYDNILVLDSGVIPSSLNDEINTVGGEYEYRKNKWRGTFQYANSITIQPLSNLDAKLHYQINPKNELLFQYQMVNKIPDHIYNLHQSSFTAYNWYNDFKNEKINNLFVTAKTQWVEAALQATVINDYLFFSNDAVDPQQQFVTPKQYDKTINYLSVKVSREFKWWKLALDNTVLYQQVDQEDDILNVPQIVTRNTLYFTDYFFQKALYLQTGFTLNYFTKFYGNDYNPVIADAFVQNQTQFGDFPMVDFFVNARIRQTRIFFKLEHLNSRMTGNNFYTAPNYPYRDFMIRFGLVWNFFQ